MKHIFYVCFFAVLLSSCTTSETNQDSESNFYALTIGNEWVYKNYRYNINTQLYDDTGVVDAVRIVGTEVVNENTYFKFRRFTTGNEAGITFCNPNGEHFELLIRMIGEDGEIILPGAFLPSAERYNLICQLDKWVISNAMSLLKSHPEFLNRIDFISINLSGQSITDERFLEFVLNEIHDLKGNATKICFEITETAAITNLFLAGKFISELRKLGCRFALDDFGSGLSSFGYLKNLAVDYLKIDGVFVKDIVFDPIDRAMVKSINEIGQVMGMETIAEFVETEEIKIMLKEIGVDYAQGYGIHKPQPFTTVLMIENNTGNFNSSN